MLVEVAERTPLLVDATDNAPGEPKLRLLLLVFDLASRAPWNATHRIKLKRYTVTFILWLRVLKLLFQTKRMFT